MKRDTAFRGGGGEQRGGGEEKRYLEWSQCAKLGGFQER